MATTSYGTPYVQSSDLVSGWPNASLNVANRIDAVSYAGNGLNAQTGTTYSIVVGDAGKTVTLNNAAAVAVTLPQDSTANLPAGAIVNFYNLGAGTVTISAGSGATFQGGPLTVTQYGYAAVIKLSANTYGPFEAVPTPPGLVQITPTSIANSGGSASVSGGEVTFSGVTSISVNGCFTSTYANYSVMLRLSASTDLSVYARLRAAGTDTSANYQSRYCQFYTGYATNTATTYIYFVTGHSNPTNSNLFIGSPQVAGHTTVITQGIDNGSGYVIGEQAFAVQTSSTQFDGITFYPNAGNISGNIRVFGYKNS